MSKVANEKRLIDATDWDSFYADMGDSRNTMDSYDRGYTDALDRVDDWMDAQPTVDAVEIVHGKWVNAADCVCFQCSNCKKYANQPYGLTEAILFKYCPNCGAKMDGDGNGS